MVGEMIYHRCIPGTSLYGYYNQAVYASAYTSRYMISDKEHKYRERKTPVYMASYLTESFSARLGTMLPEIIPEETLKEIRNTIKVEIEPFDAKSVSTYKALVERDLKYCPVCMKKGQHFVYQQLKTSDTCRVHSVPLRKGCPYCNSPLPATIEVSNIDAFRCPTCGKNIIEIPTAAKMTSELFRASKENKPHVKPHQCVDETAAYVFTMKGKDDIFDPADASEGVSFLKEYINTGKKTVPTLTVRKKQVERTPLFDLVYPYVKDDLKRYCTKAEALQYAVDYETTENSPEKRAAAYLMRKTKSSLNPRRMDITPFKRVSSELRKLLKENGLDNYVELLVTAIMEQYISDTYFAVKTMIERNSGKSLMLMIHEGIIPEVGYGVVILEDRENFYLYLFKD